MESSAAIRLCYERALITSPRAREGTILLRWEISPSGQTTHVQVIRDALAMETLTRCLVAQVRSWIFPPCSGSCTVTYPFEFFTQA